ncbi:MAG: riboflavin biosynthesis protein RibF [Verrucomicrobiota bacterium]
MSYVSLDEVQLPRRPLHLAVGMFDGVHLGHQSVIDAAIQSARRTAGVAGVLTFSPHPSHLFRPKEATQLLMPLEQKSRFLEAIGVNQVIVQHFTKDFAAVSAEAFPAYLKDRLPGLTAIYVGENFRFGKGRQGDIPLLVAQCRQLGLHVFSAERINLDGEPISSTRIRACLTEGQMAQANALLGYAYTAEGVVVSGRRLGSKLDFPTLNLSWEPELKPRYGVYAVRVGEPGSDISQPAVANYGVRPTVEEAAATPLLEVHVLEPTEFSYGDSLTVEWLDFLRPEMKFDSVAELQAQIARDTEAAKRYHAQA